MRPRRWPRRTCATRLPWPTAGRFPSRASSRYFQRGCALGKQRQRGQVMAASGMWLQSMSMPLRRPCSGCTRLRSSPRLHSGARPINASASAKFTSPWMLAVTPTPVTRAPGRLRVHPRRENRTRKMRRPRRGCGRAKGSATSRQCIRPHADEAPRQSGPSGWWCVHVGFGNQFAHHFDFGRGIASSSAISNAERNWLDTLPRMEHARRGGLRSASKDRRAADSLRRRDSATSQPAILSASTRSPIGRSCMRGTPEMRDFGSRIGHHGQRSRERPERARACVTQKERSAFRFGNCPPCHARGPHDRRWG